jgi:hypothetical protein
MIMEFAEKNLKCEYAIKGSENPETAIIGELIFSAYN